MGIEGWNEAGQGGCCTLEGSYASFETHSVKNAGCSGNMAQATGLGCLQQTTLE